MLGWLVVAMPAHAFYDPSLGRWLNRDPVGEKSDRNLYRYVLNDSVSRLDAYGLQVAQFGAPVQFPVPPAPTPVNIPPPCAPYPDCIRPPQGDPWTKEDVDELANRYSRNAAICYVIAHMGAASSQKHIPSPPAARQFNMMGAAVFGGGFLGSVAGYGCCKLARPFLPERQQSYPPLPEVLTTK